jgi:hypothetical protein
MARKARPAFPKTWLPHKPALGRDCRGDEDGKARAFHQGTRVASDPHDAGYMAATASSTSHRGSSCAAGRTIYEGQSGAPIARGLGQAVDDLMRIDWLKPFQGEGRACTIPQQSFQSRSSRSSPARSWPAMHTEASSEKPPLSQPSMARASAVSNRPLRANQRSTRQRTCSPMPAISAAVSADRLPDLRTENQ